MNLYTKALKYIDMNRVKELHEEKIKRKKIADEIEEQIREQLRNLNSPEFSNWRYELGEGMTTSDLMNTSLPPQDLANYTTDQIVDQDALNNDSLIPPDATATTSSDGQKTWTMNNSPDPGSAAVVAGFNVDLSRMDTISVSVYFTNATIDTDGADLVIDGPAGSGLQQVVALSAPGSGSGVVNHNANPTITINPELRIKGAHVAFSFVGQTIDGTRQVGTDAVKITSCFPYRRNPMNVLVGLDDPEATNFIRTDPIMKGLSSGERKKKLEDMLDAGDEYLLKHLGMTGSSARPSETALVEPFKKDVVDWQGRWASQGSDIANKMGGVTPTPDVADTQSAPKNSTEKFADDNGLPRDYKDKLSKANAYFHNNLKFLPQRTDGALERMNDLMKKAYRRQGFTKDQIDTIERKQLLKNTYGASPSYKEPEPETSSTNQFDDPDKYRNKVYVDPKTFQRLYNKKVGNTSQPSSQSTSTSNSFSNIRVGNTSKTSSDVKDYGNIAQSDNVDRQIDNMLLRGLERGDYGTGPNIQKQIDNLKRNLRNKTPGGSFLPLAGGRSTMNVAHYKPEGEVLSEKKKLKSVKDVTSKIPGYYDGKPAPLGFPMQEPPKMVNGFHPDLVDGKKIANRFNRLDPQSAKAMPPTGNPHIDKKVRAAAKKSR